MKDDSEMFFGEHKGKKLANVPAYYLLWLNDQEWFNEKASKDHKYKELLIYINNNMDVLNQGK